MKKMLPEKNFNFTLIVRRYHILKAISRFCFHSKSRIANFANKMHSKFRFQLNFFSNSYSTLIINMDLS